MTTKVNVIFEGREELLHTIDSGGEIVELLGLPKEDKCALMGSTIKLTKELGRGQFGQVFLIDFAPHLGLGEKLYVVKKALMTLSVFNGSQQKAERYLENEGTDWESVRKWQPQEYIDTWENANHYDNVSVVLPPKMCLTSADDPERTNYLTIPYVETYTDSDAGANFMDIVKIYNPNFDFNKTGRVFKIPDKSYVCSSEAFSELAISLYVGELYRTGTCANFFNTYSMFTCIGYDGDTSETEGEELYTQYTFMDKIDGDLNKYRGCVAWDKYMEESKRIPSEICDGVYVQTLCAIAMYQHYLQLSHNDLHTGNLFVELVNDKTMFNRKLIKEYDYYHYHISGYNIYLPAIPLVVKIGDYGLSTKYSKPVIASHEVMVDGMNTQDGTGAWIPNIYIPQYDSLYFTAWYAMTMVKGDTFGNATSLLSECIKFMCKDIEGVDDDAKISESLITSGYIKPGNRRPVLSNLIKLDVKNAMDTLLNPVLKYYGNKPPVGSNVITLGGI